MINNSGLNHQYKNINNKKVAISKKKSDNYLETVSSEINQRQ